MNFFYTAITVLLFAPGLFGQSTLLFADSIRVHHHIPELGYAVVSSSGIKEMHLLGEKKINTALIADSTDRFRIGSNTKAITGFIAAQLVKEKKIHWDTKFFDLFPELKRTSKKVYHQLTLLDLLSFRTRLYAYTYTYDKPEEAQFSGTEEEQRYEFVAWFFRQKPVKENETKIHFSNLGYVAAGLMLEKVSNKTYKKLVEDLGKQLGVSFGFGAPNSSDSLQTWGHNSSLVPEPPGDSFKLNWLLAAGNINMTLPDYSKFIQLQLQGLNGKSDWLTKEEFEFLHYGLPVFSVGWFQGMDNRNRVFSYNVGNPGSFLSCVYVYGMQDLAFIIFTNAQTEDANSGIMSVLEELQKTYVK